MQILLLDELPHQGLTHDGPVDPGTLRDDRNREIGVAGVRAAVRLRPTDGGPVLEGRIVATVSLECGRCLTRFELPIEADVDLRIVTSEDSPSDPELQVTAPDAAQLVVEDGKLDLGRVAREQIYLGFPLKPTCRSDCRGLCPTCGADRNGIECDCSRERADERWAPLAKLRQRLAETGGHR